MQPSLQKPQRLRDYTNIPFEIFIVALSILPFFVLAYFYPALPERVPVFLNLKGEVQTWAEKSLLSVFRVPLMAALTQTVCLLMKYGTVQSKAAAPLLHGAEQRKLQRQYLSLSANLWDWFRWSVAFKMSAESLDTVFLSMERFKYLSRPTFITTAIAALLGVAGALLYTYRLFIISRKMKKEFVDETNQKPVDERCVFLCVFYFNPDDSALFASKYVFNFANRWAWVFIACIVAYPLLVFLPE